MSESDKVEILFSALLLIYAKSDQADVSLEEIREAIQRGVAEA